MGLEKTGISQGSGSCFCHSSLYSRRFTESQQEPRHVQGRLKGKLFSRTQIKSFFFFLIVNTSKNKRKQTPYYLEVFVHFLGRAIDFFVIRSNTSTRNLRIFYLYLTISPLRYKKQGKRHQEGLMQKSLAINSMQAKGKNYKKDLARKHIIERDGKEHQVQHTPFYKIIQQCQLRPRRAGTQNSRKPLF